MRRNWLAIVGLIALVGCSHSQVGKKPAAPAQVGSEAASAGADDQQIADLLAKMSLENKVAQVMRQLHNKQARVVFDLKSETANIVPCR